MLPRPQLRGRLDDLAVRRSSPGRHGALALLTAAGLVGALATFVAGCPIYSADSCAQDPQCNPYPDQPAVDASTGGGTCVPSCTPGYVCSYTSTNRYGCVAYDCRSAERACSARQACVDLGGGVYGCTGADAGADTLDAPDGDTKEAGPIDCSTPGIGCIAGYKCVADAVGHHCASTDPDACVEDGDCTAKTGAGSLCLGGLCKAPKDLCTDSTQCPSGKDCVDGRCAQQCGGDGGGAACPSGYACVSGACVGGTGVCSAPASGDAGVGDGAVDAIDASEAASDAAVDGGSCKNACVGTRCVDKCALDGSCPAGLVCDGVGCVPDDRPIFFCDKAGTADGTQDLCAAGSICLHHNCYLSCTGPSDTTSCASADKFPICKSVTTSSGDHYVCGSASGLGADCDPTTTPPKTCAAGQFCIDGFCK